MAEKLLQAPILDPQEIIKLIPPAFGNLKISTDLMAPIKPVFGFSNPLT